MNNDYRTNNRSNDRYEEPPRGNDGRDNDRRGNDRQDQGHTSNGPSHIAFSVREGEEGKAYFNRIGSAFPHKDGQGFNVMLDATPVDGRVTLRTPKERLDDMNEGKRSKTRGATQQRDEGPHYDR